jgi:hypothetical protein
MPQMVSIVIYKAYKKPGSVQCLKMYQFLALGLRKCQNVVFKSHKATTDKRLTAGHSVSNIYIATSTCKLQDG